MSLNDAQQQAVSSPCQHLLVLAGAGSGKTRVLIQRLGWLLEQGLMPSQVMAVTFTNKAATEMRDRLSRLFPFNVHHLWVGTFHGLSHRLLRLHTEDAGLPDGFQLIDSDDQYRLIKRMMREEGLEAEAQDIQQAQNFINRQKDEMRRSDRVRIDSRKDEWMHLIYTRYEDHCRRLGLVDFGEIILRVYELWKNKPEIIAHYRAQFKHVLVDEFQDTNTIQYQWLLALVGTTGGLTVVGDDDQSIYSWRGAKIENMQRLGQTFSDLQVIRLEQNYRSTTTILDAANALISCNGGRMGKNLWTEQQGTQKLKLYPAFNDLDEARFISESIAAYLKQGKSPKDIAILYRSNAQSRVLEQVLTAAFIPFRVYGGARFFERAEIKDVLAYCRLVQHSRDDSAFERVINVPPRGVGDRTLEKIRLLAKEKTLSLWEAAQLWLGGSGSGKAAQGVGSFLATLGYLKENQTIPLPKLIEMILEKSGLLRYLAEQTDEKALSKRENCTELLTATQEFIEQVEAEPSEHLPLFLAEVSLHLSDDRSQEEDKVKLMTVHAAKGLEFPIVFMSGLEDGLFPNHRATSQLERLEEERRLLYVGMTRAMQSLILSYAQKRGYQTFGSRPSRFLEEIPLHLVERTTHNTYNAHRPIFPSSTAKPTILREASGTFGIGTRVRHTRFGEGVVVAEEGNGEKERVEVQFSNRERKWLMVSYARLEKC